MTQLTVHASDAERGRLEPAYTVWVAGGRASVRAFRPEWAETARRMEIALNAGIQPRAEMARAAEQEVPVLR